MVLWSFKVFLEHIISFDPYKNPESYVTPILKKQEKLKFMEEKWFVRILRVGKGQRSWAETPPLISVVQLKQSCSFLKDILKVRD